MCKTIDSLYPDPKDELVSYCPLCQEEAKEYCGHCPHCKEPIDVIWINPKTDEEVDISLI